MHKAPEAFASDPNPYPKLAELLDELPLQRHTEKSKHLHEADPLHQLITTKCGLQKKKKNSCSC